MREPLHQRFGEWGILLLLSCSILWKGGKSLEMTWLLALLGGILAVTYWLFKHPITGLQGASQRATSATNVKTGIPLSLWVAGIGLILWSVISFIFSSTKNYGLDEVFRTTSYLLIFFWIARQRVIHEHKEFLLKFARVISVCAVIAVIAGIIIYTFQPVSRFVGTFYDHRFHTDYWPNAWGQFLLLAWPMMLLMACRQEKQSAQIRMFAVLGVILGALFLSYSRGALLAAGAQVLVIAFLYGGVLLNDVRYRRIMRTVIRSVLFKSAGTLLVAFLFFLSVNALRSNFYDVQSVADKVTFNAAEGKSSINERAQFWEQATALTLERPLLGWGPYSFRFTQPRRMQDVLATSDHAHNVFLKFASERGIPAMLLFAFIIFYVLVSSFVSHFTTRRAMTYEHDADTILLTAAVAGVLAHNMIDYNLQFVGVGLSFWICAGLLVQGKVFESGNVAASFRRWKTARILTRLETLAALSLLLVAFWEGGQLVVSSFGRHADAAGNDERAIVWYGRSHASLFTRDLYLSEAQIHMRQGNLSDAGVALASYEKLNAEDPRLWKLKGMLALRNGSTEEAHDAFVQAYEYGKYTDLGILELLLETERKIPGMENHSSKLEYDEVFSAYAKAIEQNTHFIALSENVESLLAVSRLLSNAYPSDEQRYKTIARSASAHAREEREIYNARSGGMLW